MSSETNKNFNELLDIIDRKLALKNIPLVQRCFFAAAEFVTEFVTKIKINGGDTEDFKTDFYEKTWFCTLYKHIESWYCDRYGEALSEHTEQSAIGVVSVYGTPFKISVPLIVKGPVEKQNKTAWFTIPKTIMEKEDVIEWFHSPPNMNSLDSTIIETLYADLSHVGSSLRSINVNLRTANIESENTRRMASDIIKHLQNAVEDILKTNNRGITYAFWELHLALEKSIKVLLLQHNSLKHHHHNLDELFNKAKNEYQIVIDDHKLSNLPSHKEAIQYRYSEIEGTNCEYAISIYNDVIELIKNTTDMLKRKIIMKNNASFLIKLPPWKC